VDTTSLIVERDSAPVAEPNVDTASLIVKRGVLSDPAQTCYDQVQVHCNNILDIIGKVDAKIDAAVAAKIIVIIKLIVALIVKLVADLKVKIAVGSLAVVDVKACVTICISIVNLCIAILAKIHAPLFVNIHVKIFANVVLALAACIKLLIGLCLDLCLGKIGGLSVLALAQVFFLVAKLQLVLTLFLAACNTLMGAGFV